MNRKRIFAIGKLVVLFGTPVALVLGLFSCGVYCGVDNRAAILSFEREWLGMDVALPGDESDDPPKVADVDTPDAKTPDGKTPDGEAGDPKAGDPKAGDPKAGDPKTGDPKAGDPRASDPTAGDPEPAEPPPETKTPPTTEPPATDPTSVDPPPPETRTDPLEGDLATRLALPVTVHLKVLVDDELITARPDWIDYVQRVVSSASQTYEKQFGISLTLTSVGRWPVSTAGMSADQLLEDIRSRPREGNDIVVGFTNRPWDDRTAGVADTPTPESPFNGAYGVVYASRGHANPHLRTLLHEVGHIFGALDITDPAEAAFRAGSWMSYAASRDTDAPWIDADNRRRILERKDMPFSPEPEAK